MGCVLVQERGPGDGLYDEDFQLLLRGFQPHSSLRLELRAVDGSPQRRDFVHAMPDVLVDAGGEATVENGAQLLCCLAPVSQGTRFAWPDVEQPVTVQVAVRSSDGAVLASASLQRRFLATHVRRVPVDVVQGTWRLQ